MYSKLKKVCTNVTEQDNNIINVLCKKQNKKKTKKKKPKYIKKITKTQKFEVEIIS